MTVTNRAAQAGASRQAVVEAALVLLERMGLTPADLAAVPQHRPEVPAFGEYVPVVTAVSAGTRRAYGSYWYGSSTSGVAGVSMSPPRRRSGS